MKNEELFLKYNLGNHWNRHSAEYADCFLSLLPAKIPADFFIVDAGCGNGKNTDFLNEVGFNVLGIDKDPEEIASASVVFPQSRFFIMDVEDLAFSNEYVDAFFLTNVIHYLDEEKALKEIWRTLKPNRFLYVHYNLLIKDVSGRVDYVDSEERIFKTIYPLFDVIFAAWRRRVDRQPFPHKHTFLELMLQKK